ncbi:MAG: 2-dehydro-3-deoxygalactonokinase [Marinoscillum sp.]
MVATNSKHSSRYFLSCDWGTSSLRLFLVNMDTQEVVESISSKNGVKLVNDQVNSIADRATVFKNILKKHIELLTSKTNLKLDGLTLVASGMVSSSIGWMELPYATLPFSTEGTRAESYLIPANDTFNHEVILISGIRDQQKDIMRGEETQLIGLTHQIDPIDGWYVFPGTHSKHLLLKNREITEFKTYMTGELFSLMAEQSILKNNIGQESAAFDEAAFLTGVDLGASDNLLHAFFTLRAMAVTTGSLVSPDQLSGLLIGYELSDTKQLSERVVICATSDMIDRYGAALNHLRPNAENQVIKASLMDMAVPLGQLKLLNQLKTY